MKENNFIRMLNIYSIAKKEEFGVKLPQKMLTLPAGFG